MKKALAIVSVALFLGMTSSPSFAGDVKTKAKAKAKTECQADTKCKKADCPKKDAKECPKDCKKACCTAKK